jgi:hypothetical protein
MMRIICNTLNFKKYYYKITLEKNKNLIQLNREAIIEEKSNLKYIPYLYLIILIITYRF